MSIRLIAVLLIAAVTALSCGKRRTPEESLATVTQAAGNVVSVCAITENDTKTRFSMEHRTATFAVALVDLDKVGEKTYCGTFKVGELARCRFGQKGVRRFTVTYMGVTEGGLRKLMTQDIPPSYDFYEFWVGIQKEPVILVSPRQSSDPPLLPAPIGSGTK